MGTVRKRGDKFFLDYIDARGQRIRQVLRRGTSEKDARKILAAHEAEATLGQHRILPMQTPRFGEYADGWLRRLAARGRRPKTLETYGDHIDVHLSPAFGAMRLAAIARRDVEAFLTQKREAGFAPSTVNDMLKVLKAILRDAVDQGVLQDSPAARVKPLAKPDAEDLHMLQPGEVRRLLESTEEPFKTLYAVAVYTGLRRGEILGLRWRDVNLQRGELAVRRAVSRVKEGTQYALREAPLKTRHSRRTIELSPTLVQALLAFPAGDDPESDYVFRAGTGGPLDPHVLDTAFHRHLVAAGLPDIPFHSTRHTHASLLIAAGVHPKAIQARLGHASITTTLNVYGHLMPNAFSGVGAQLDALVQGTGKAQESDTARKPLQDKPERRMSPYPLSRSVRRVAFSTAYPASSLLK